MCKNYRIVSIHTAQRDAERNPSPTTGHINYWRTDSGTVRKIGWVARCACGNHQLWARTQTELVLELKERYGEQYFSIGNMPKIVATNVRKKLVGSSTSGE